MSESKHEGRKERNRRVAEKAIGNLARSTIKDEPTDTSRSSSLPVSSTPTGISYAPSKEDNAENWPGPWSTARVMLKKREEVKQKRLAAIAEKLEGKVIEDEDIDIYESRLSKLLWNSSVKSSVSSQSRCIPSLSEICLDFLALNFDSISDLGNLPNEIRDKLALKLVCERKLSPNAVVALAVPGSYTFSIPDCSNISESVLIEALKKVCSPDASASPHTDMQSQNDDNPDVKRRRVSHHTSNQLKSLNLNHCGYGFGDSTVNFLLEGLGSNLGQGEDIHPVESTASLGLETLTLGGCYRLSDTALSKLIINSQHSLQALELYGNSRLTHEAIRSISSLPCLKRLVISESPQIQNADLLCLITKSSVDSSHNASPLPCLCHLALEGFSDVTDDVFVELLSVFGSRLTTLSLKDNSRVTDRTLVAIREHCQRLMSLDLTRANRLSAEGLITLFIDVSLDAIPDINSTSYSTPTKIGLLEKVYLSGLDAVTDDVIEQLCLSSAGGNTGLTHLDISSCPNVTGKSALLLLDHCADSLQDLNVSFVRQISEAALGTLIEACKDIQRLEVWGCSQLTSKFFGCGFNGVVRVEGEVKRDGARVLGVGV